MGFIAMIIGIGIMLYVFVYEFVIPDLQLKEKNKEWIQQNGKKKFKLCIKCKYCVKKKYHPFPYGEYYNVMVQDIPMYCKKFKKQLNNKYDCRCIARDYAQAIYEDEE